MSSFEDYDDMVEALLVLFKEYLSPLGIAVFTDDVEWYVTKAGIDLVQWMLDDLHITLSYERNRVILHAPESLGKKYLARKVEMLWDTLKEIGDGD